MPPTPQYTQQPWTETYSEIIDVRSPSEFAEDHIPGAINLPVLNDGERAEVGTMYKQISAFTAKKRGAALVTKNISQHISQHFATKEKGYHPLVYCWRGGQRSCSMALVLTQIGWRVTVLEGGYKTYRNYVRQQLEHLPTKFTYRILCGLTGSGKTHILRQMQRCGAQVLDLEALANHRGSLLGEEWGSQPTPQPSQKRFESLLLQQLQTLNPAETIWVESESNKVGQIYLPKSLWETIKKASCVEIQIPRAARVQFLLKTYPHFTQHPNILKAKLEKLQSRYGKKKLHEWYQLIDKEQWELFVSDMLEIHYDPSYYKSMKGNFYRVEKKLEASDLSDSNVATLLNAVLPGCYVSH